MGIESLRRVHGLAAGDWKVDEAEGEGHKPSVATALSVEEVSWGILCARWGVCGPGTLTDTPWSTTVSNDRIGSEGPGNRQYLVRLTDMLYKADP